MKRPIFMISTEGKSLDEIQDEALAALAEYLDGLEKPAPEPDQEPPE